jgi:hypothetical protein
VDGGASSAARVASVFPVNCALSDASLPIELAPFFWFDAAAPRDLVSERAFETLVAAARTMLDAAVPASVAIVVAVAASASVWSGLVGWLTVEVVVVAAPPCPACDFVGALAPFAFAFSRAAAAFALASAGVASESGPVVEGSFAPSFASASVWVAAALARAACRFK